jgi:hypothetical protein
MPPHYEKSKIAYMELQYSMIMSGLRVIVSLLAKLYSRAKGFHQSNLLN